MNHPSKNVWFVFAIVIFIIIIIIEINNGDTSNNYIGLNDREYISGS